MTFHDFLILVGALFDGLIWGFIAGLHWGPALKRYERRLERRRVRSAA